MKAFIVHRTTMRDEAKSFIHSLKKSHCFVIEPIFLRNSNGKNWKKRAAKAIESSEAVIVFDADACAQSDNTEWEISISKELKKNIIELSRFDISSKKLSKLQEAYDFEEEFQSCFSSSPNSPSDLLELYKTMVNSSEELIRRRQITNGFFTTIIGSIVAATGFAIKEKLIIDNGVLFLIFPTLIGLLMCKSWANLIDNYGKLNAGKFKVIHALERQLGPRIFEAEWIALGKGLRREKYKSFTSTERNVPNLFSGLLCIVLISILLSTKWSDLEKKIYNIYKETYQISISLGNCISTYK